MLQSLQQLELTLDGNKRSGICRAGRTFSSTAVGPFITFFPGVQDVEDRTIDRKSGIIQEPRDVRKGEAACLAFQSERLAFVNGHVLW